MHVQYKYLDCSAIQKKVVSLLRSLLVPVLYLLVSLDPL